jgi:MFS family permease
MPRTLADLRTGRFTLAAMLLSVTNFLGVFDGLVVTVALPAIEKDLDISQLNAQWMITAYALPLGGMLLVGGRFGDRYGHRRVLVVGLYLFVVGLLGSGLSPTAWLTFLSRAIQGVGAALAIPNSYAIISTMRSAERRNKVFTAVAVAGSSGAAGGAIIGGLITQTLGWRYVFFLTAPVAIVAAVTAPHLLATNRTDDRLQRLHGGAAALSTGGLMLLIFAITNTERAGILSPATLGAFVLSVVLLAVLFLHERSTAAPLVRPGLFRIRPLRASIAGMPGQVFAYQGTVFIGLLFFQQVLGYSPIQAGLAFAPLGIAALLGSPLTTHLMKRWHWSIVAAAAQVTCAIGLVLLSMASPKDSYISHFLPGLILLGFGIAVAAVTLNVAAGKDVSVREKGVTYGLFETSTHISGAFVVASLATIATARARTTGMVEPVTALAAGYQLAFTAAAAAALLCGIMTVVLGRRRISSDTCTPTG